jgi:hypothetical protein
MPLVINLKEAAAALRKMAGELPTDEAPVAVEPSPVVTKVAMPQADSAHILNFMKFYIKASKS